MWGWSCNSLLPHEKTLPGNEANSEEIKLHLTTGCSHALSPWTLQLTWPSKLFCFSRLNWVSFPYKYLLLLLRTINNSPPSSVNKQTVFSTMQRPLGSGPSFLPPISPKSHLTHFLYTSPTTSLDISKCHKLSGSRSQPLSKIQTILRDYLVSAVHPGLGTG